MDQEEQNHPLNDRTDDTASKGSPEQRRQNKQFYQRCSLKVTCGVTRGVFLVLCTVLIVVAAAPSNTSASAAGNSKLTGSDTQEKIGSIQRVKRHEGNDCQRYKSHTGYRDCAANSSLGCIGKCMDCNGTCRNYSSMVQYLGKQSPCTEDIETIKCCTLLHMLPDNYWRCEGDMNKPKCTCPVGWTGDNCETPI